MNREAFVPPTAGQGDFLSSSMKSYGVKYMCGDCGAHFTLNKGDAVRCKECGHRILYKARTRRMGSMKNADGKLKLRCKLWAES